MILRQRIFDEVDLGAAERQAVQADALKESVEGAGLKGTAGVDGGVVQDDQTGFLSASGWGGEGVGGNNTVSDGVKETLIDGADET